jgi:hypothetical protein
MKLKTRVISAENAANVSLCNGVNFPKVDYAALNHAARTGKPTA